MLRHHPSDLPALRGFTLIELIATMVILGVLAVVALPKLSGTAGFRQTAYHDEVVATLRYAQKTAISHRRLVCATVAASTVTLTVAATNPAVGCGTATLNGPDGNSAYAVSLDPTNATSTIAPAGPIYFQSTGTATNASGVITDYTVTISGTPSVNIAVSGATGYVQ